ncbi:MAG: hypothetical protein ILN61_06670 [Lachnospiraceae bacterium]|nr:hypothetical protein [Lachnospiraceae bacterium]
MKKKKLVFTALFIMLCALMLNGCCIKHEWEDATCEEPETCSKCGKTRGEALGHDWEDADCEHPKTCKECGETKGKAKGHDWEEATCETPKTCKKCGKTEGEALGHDWIAATIDSPKKCSLCGIEEGDPVSVKELNTDMGVDWDTRRYSKDRCICVKHANNAIKMWFFDLDNNMIYNEDYALNYYGSWSYSTAMTDKIALITTRSREDGKNCDIRFFDWDGNEVYTTTVEEPYDTYYVFYRTDDKNVVEMRYANSDKTICYFDTNSFRQIAADEGNYKTYGSDVTYDESRWTYCEKEDAVDGYFVGNENTHEWGYLDADMNELKIYKDASAFNCYGYALATEDGYNYDIIDKDFNVVAKDFFKGSSAYISCRGSAVLICDTNEGSKAVVVGE